MAWLKNLVRPAGFRWVSTLMAILLTIPMGWKEATGLYIWFSPFVMLNSVFVLKSIVWFNGLAFVILIFSLLRKRWFCRNLCPVGWACDHISSCSIRKHFSVWKIPHAGKWLAIVSLVAASIGFPFFALLDPMAIFNSFFTVFTMELSCAVVLSLMGFPILLATHIFFPGIWCARLCPLGGLLDILPVLKVKTQNIPTKRLVAKPLSDQKRRLFLASGTGLLAGLILPRFFKVGRKDYFRPPGSVQTDLFNMLCLRCGNCIKSCPSDILIHRLDFGDPMAWMIPEISFEKGYCLENCNLCSQVCPSGAITLFSPQAKNKLAIGLAKLVPDKCFLLNHKECDRCKAACTYNAINIVSENAFTTLPVIDRDKCIGCGACAVICPPETIKMNPI